MSSLIAFERMTSAKAMEIIIIIIVFSFYVYDAKITVARANLRHRILKVNISPPPQKKNDLCNFQSGFFETQRVRLVRNDCLGMSAQARRQGADTQ